MDDNEKPSSDKNKRDWVETCSKLLIPIVIFAAGALLTLEKNWSDQANIDFQLESDVLKQATSKDLDEQNIGLMRLKMLKDRGSKIASDLKDLVEQQNRARKLSGKNVRDELVQNIVCGLAPNETGDVQPNNNQISRVYIQIAKEDQRTDADKLANKLKSANFAVQDLDLVQQPTQNNYVRYFSAKGEPYADKVLQTMKDLGFTCEKQPFINTQDQSASPSL